MVQYLSHRRSVVTLLVLIAFASIGGAADAQSTFATMTGTIENQWNGRRAIAGREGRGMELGTGSGGARIQIRSFKGNVRVSAK